MTRISPAPEAQLDASKDLLAMAAAAMGFEANSLKVMARQPVMLQGFMGLSAAILGPNASLDPVLRQMIAHISSAAAGSAPNQSTDEHFEALRAHFSEDEIVEIVGVIALFGFLNRWNDTLATTLEDSPLAFAEAHLAPKGWVGDKHRD